MKALALIGVLALAACTTAQKERVETTANALCTSVPLAQVAYNVAVQNHDSDTVNAILNTLRISCPAVLTAIHTYQPPESPPAPAIVPTPGPERG